VGAKNGALICKHTGYGHIAAQHSQRIQGFYEYLNFHRPCAQGDIEVVDA
jgi:hypothetical protein